MQQLHLIKILLEYIHVQTNESLLIKYVASKYLYHDKNVSHEQEVVFASQELYPLVTYTSP